MKLFYVYYVYQFLFRNAGVSSYKYTSIQMYILTGACIVIKEFEARICSYH